MDDAQARCEKAERWASVHGKPREEMCGPLEADGAHALFLLREALALLQPSVADVTLHGRDVADWQRRLDALVAAAEKGPT